MTLEEKATQLVNQARAIPSLNVPAYDWWNESLHGVAVSGTTEFPEPVVWQPHLTRRESTRCVAIGTEGRIKHAQNVRAVTATFLKASNFWAPNINIFRDPRCGRGQEHTAKIPSSPRGMA